MKYNILTVSNQDYFPFLSLFIKSLFKNADSARLAKVYVFNTGLNSASKDFLKDFGKVEIVDTGKKTKHTKLHDEDWCLNTYSKCDYLSQVISFSDLPSFMIDVDSVFQKPFEQVINPFADIVTCYRPNSHISSHIGSFFGALEKHKSLLFIKIWKETINNITNFKHKESPALSRVIKNYSEDFKIQHVYEDDISCVKKNKEALIYHLKSDGYAQTIEDRLLLPYAKESIDKIK